MSDKTSDITSDMSSDMAFDMTSEFDVINLLIEKIVTIDQSLNGI